CLRRFPPTGNSFPQNVANSSNQQNSGKGLQQVRTGGACNRCTKYHGNKPCQFGTGVCYTCGRLGHISRDCPNKKEGVTSSRPQPNPPEFSNKEKCLLWKQQMLQLSVSSFKDCFDLM
ncbi:hypothetical protein PIB30_111440, partial [Stylosanthes scabra]|nr:hypothetical protein [Stylosanthes scabra]